MIPDLSWWARLFGVLTVEAGLAIAVAALVARASHRPQVQRLVWQICLLTVLLAWLGELAGFRGQFGRGRQAPTGTTVEQVATPSSSAPPPTETAEPAGETVAPSPSPSPSKLARRESPISAPVYWPGGVWLMGVVLLLMKAMIARFRLWIWLRRSPRDSVVRAHSADDRVLTEAASLVARWRGPLGLKKVRLMSWDGLRSPVAFGVWRPTIVLPRDFSERFSAPQRDAMIAHELAHLAGRDPLWLWLTEVVCAVAWWHPAVWWAGREFRAACESAADEASALTPDGRTALAELLVSLGRELTTTGPARGLGVSGSGLRSELARRVTALLRPQRERQRLPVSARWLGAGSAILASASLALFPAALAHFEAAPWATLADAVIGKSADRLTAAATPLPQSPVEEAGGSAALLTQVFPINLTRLRQRVAAPAPEELLDAAVERMRDLPNSAVGDFGGSRPLSANSARPSSAMVAPRPGPRILAAGNRESAAAAYLFRELSAAVPALHTGLAVFADERPASSLIPSQPFMYFSDQKGTLLVKANLRDLEKVKHTLAGLNLLPTEDPVAFAQQSGANPESNGTPVVRLVVQFVEITAGGDEDIGLDWLFGRSPTNNPPLESGPATNLLAQSDAPKGENVRVELLRTEGESATLTTAQFAALRARLEGRPGVDFLSGPEITSFSGQAAQLAISEIRTVVTGVQATNGAPTQSAGVNYFVEKVEVGPIVDVVPTAERGAWRIGIKARVTEFLGYDEPPTKKFVLGPDGQRTTYDEPLPRLRVRVIEAESRASMGETVALRGPLVVDTKKIKGGFFRRDRIETTRKRLYVFVTTQPAEP